LGEGEVVVLLLLLVVGGVADAVGVAVVNSWSGVSFHTALIGCFGGVDSSSELLLEVFEGSGAMRRRVSKKRRMPA